MFETKLKETSKKIGNGKLRVYYVITNKGGRREIYFKNQKNPIQFMKEKFDSPKKRIIYFLIKLGFLQNFLKKIKLSEKFGDIIYVAEQVKGFDLGARRVLSIPLEIKKSDFIRSKKFQKEISKEGFAPEIFEINEDVPFSMEELLPRYNGKNKMIVFEKLSEFYNRKGLKKIPFKEVLDKINLEMKRENILDRHLKKFLNKIPSSSEKIVFVKAHGDLNEDHILLKKKDLLFVDWGLNKERVITTDALKYFKFDEDLLENKEFIEVSKTYPREVRENLALHLLVGRLFLSILRKENSEKVIKNSLPYLNKISNKKNEK